jgi:hypothetical protein
VTTRYERGPVLSIWVPGAPKSAQGGSRARYREKIRQLASKKVSKPLKGSRIDVEIVYGAEDRKLRADVDNVAKPILDAFKGVVYDDDNQVRSLRVVAVHSNESGQYRGSFGVHQRVEKGEDFLVNVYVGRALAIPATKARQRRAKTR